MGHQVNFYMLPEDLREFEEWFLGSENGVSAIKYRLLTAKIETVKTLAVDLKEQSWLTLFLARETDYPQITFRKVEAQGYWTIDSLLSPVMELDRSFYDGNIVRRGRLYFQTGYYDENGKWVNKPESFLRWGDKLLAWVRKKYKKESKSGFYVGPFAEKWIAKGGIIKAF